MKKILLFAAALAGLFLASCQRENLEPEVAGKTVTFTVEAPAALQTKAIADGMNVDQLIYEVWITGKNQNVSDLITSGATRLYQATTTNKTVADGKVSFKIALDLVNDQNFTVLFWAQNSANRVYKTEKLTEVTYLDGADMFANNANRDAFYGSAYVIDGATETPTVTLHRPFAQVNLCTVNLKDTQKEGDYTITLSESKMSFTTVPNKFNIATGDASGEMTLAFDYKAVPSGEDQMIKVNGKDYYYAGMNFVFADKLEGNTARLEYDIKTILNNTTTITAEVNNVIDQIPLKQNYRTNIVGNLLTSKVDYEIIVDADFEGEYFGPEFVKIPAYDEQTATWTITNLDELLYVAQQVNTVTKAASGNFAGQTIKLANDIDLKGMSWTPIGYTSGYSSTDNIYFAGTFDGDGHTIKNFKIEATDNHAGFFGHVRGGVIKNVTFEKAEIVSSPKAAAPAAAVVVASAPYGANIINVNVKNSTVAAGGYAGVIGGYVAGTITDCKVDECDIIATPYMYEGVYDKGAKVGGILGYQQGAGNAGANFPNMISDNTVQNVLIRGTRDLGGIVGYSVVEVNECTVKNVEIIANQTLLPNPENYELGEVVGRGPKTGTDNVVENVSICHEFEAGDIDELNTVITAANAVTGTSLILFKGDITGNATINQTAGANITIDGCDKTFDGTFYLEGRSENTSPETLDFKNINFYHEGDATTDFYFINANSGTYAHNVTVDNCSFEGVEGNKNVAMIYRQCFNMTVKNSTATALHSLIQAYGTKGLTIEGVEVEAGRGVSLGSSTDVVITGSSFDVDSYGVRGDGNGNHYDISVSVVNSTINAKQPIVVRKVTDEKHTYNVTLSGETTLTPTTVGDYQVVFTNGADDAEYVIPTGKWNLDPKEQYSYYPEPAVAKVGGTEYTSIANAISNWTNGSTLTLLADVTLSDVITLKSTEYHVLDLGTFTMTAASKKDAITITADGRTSASYALDIKADATNPGGITAKGKAVVKTTGKSGVKDRPIIRFYNGVFNATNIIYHSGSNGTNCPQFQFHNGVYNGTIYANRALIQFYGGTFNGSLQMSVDSSAYALILGGRFKQLSNLYGSALNSDKFTIGSSKGVYDRGIYVDDEGYFVVGGLSITDFTIDFEARVPIAPGVNDYLYYSSAKSVGYLYYTNKDKVKKSDESKMELNPSFNN